MLNIGEKVVHVNGGVFEIFEKKLMNYGYGDIIYYCLKPYYINETNKTLIVYVPEEKVSELIRPVMNKNEAYELINILKNVEPIWYNDAKVRKQKFSELYTSKKLNNICIILKSLYTKQIELQQNNRYLNLVDYDFLLKIKKSLEEEIALALNCDVDEIEKIISKSM